MSRLKRIIALVALLLGLVGALACVAMIIGSLVIDSRLRAVARTGYSDADELLNRTRTRVRQLGEAVDGAKITTSDVKQSLADLTRSGARQRLSQQANERFQLDRKANDLAVTLAKADNFAEMSAESVSLVINVTEAANQAGARFDTQGLASLETELKQLQGKLEEAVSDVTDLSARLRDESEGPEPRDRLAAAAELAVRVLATLEVIQTGLDRLDERLGDSQQKVSDSEPRLLGWMNVALAAVIFLLVWNFAGQFTLMRSGWRNMRAQ